jgi:hypothetical protein
VQPETLYARSGDISIAYQVTGDGPFDVVFIPPFVTHVELVWTTSFAASLWREDAGPPEGSPRRLMLRRV